MIHLSANESDTKNVRKFIKEIAAAYQDQSINGPYQLFHSSETEQDSNDEEKAYQKKILSIVEVVKEQGLIEKFEYDSPEDIHYENGYPRGSRKICTIKFYINIGQLKNIEQKIYDNIKKEFSVFSNKALKDIYDVLEFLSNQYYLQKDIKSTFLYLKKSFTEKKDIDLYLKKIKNKITTLNYHHKALQQFLENQEKVFESEFTADIEELPISQEEYNEAIEEKYQYVFESHKYIFLYEPDKVFEYEVNILQRVLQSLIKENSHNGEEVIQIKNFEEEGKYYISIQGKIECYGRQKTHFNILRKFPDNFSMIPAKEFKSQSDRKDQFQSAKTRINNEILSKYDMEIYSEKKDKKTYYKIRKK